MIVVGGGLIGCASAFFLAEGGARPLLVEREDIAAGASGACDGHVTLQTKQPGVHLRLAVESAELLAEAPERLGEDVGYRSCGSWVAATDEAELLLLRERAALWAEQGVPLVLASGAEVRAAEPAVGRAVVGGSFCAADSQVDPWRLALALARAAGRSGAMVRCGAEVTGLIEREGRILGVEAAGEPMYASRTVLAAGAWTAPLLARAGLSVLLRPRPGEIIVTEPAPPLLRSLVLSAGYLRAKATPQQRQVSLVAEQVAEGNILIGGTRELVGWRGCNSAESAHDLARQTRWILPVVARLNAIRCFSGLRPCTGDGLPIIGWWPERKGLFVAAGHDGDGVCLSLRTGQLVAEALLQGRELPAELCPDRLLKAVGAGPPQDADPHPARRPPSPAGRGQG